MTTNPMYHMKKNEILNRFPEVENKCCPGNFMHMMIFDDSRKEVNNGVYVCLST